uniref:Cadherin domain-containing protein n=1 Tax=Astyanax mexicanus TaxID=7994 RepID=A0A3B1J026_ASTMX
MDLKPFAAVKVILAYCFFMVMANSAFGDVSYSFPEEMKRGSVIGNLAKDLGLNVNRLSARRARIDTEGNLKRYCDINANTGELTVAERIDREGLCKEKMSCLLNFDIVLENPLELHRIALHITDINDNSPVFPRNLIKLEITESADKGSSYRINDAHDSDIGVNAVQAYSLQNNAYFILNVNSNNNEGKQINLVLDKELDRELEKEVSLILTAVDGGTPPNSGTVTIHVTVLDANDNAPVFSESVYEVNLSENSPIDTLVASVKRYVQYVHSILLANDSHQISKFES